MTCLLTIVASMEADFAIDPTIKELVVDFKVSISAAKAFPPFEYMPYIYHSVQFKKY